MTYSGEQREKNEQNEQSIKDLWNTIKHTNICITGVLEGVDRSKRKVSEEMMARKIPNLVKNIY